VSGGLRAQSYNCCAIAIAAFGRRCLTADRMRAAGYNAASIVVKIGGIKGTRSELICDGLGNTRRRRFWKKVSMKM
jgi:hypothetical protein